MNTSQHRRTAFVLSATAPVLALLLAVGTLPAAARQEAGPSNPQPASTPFCAIERVGSQYVACDNLTGNGVPAPAWVGER